MWLRSSHIRELPDWNWKEKTVRLKFPGSFVLALLFSSNSKATMGQESTEEARPDHIVVLWHRTLHRNRSWYCRQSQACPLRDCCKLSKFGPSCKRCACLSSATLAKLSAFPLARGKQIRLSLFTRTGRPLPSVGRLPSTYGIKV